MLKSSSKNRLNRVGKMGLKEPEEANQLPHNRRFQILQFQTARFLNIYNVFCYPN
jgi:hypothetical protein